MGEAEDGRCQTTKSSEAGSGVGGRGPREFVRQNGAAKVCHIMRPAALMRHEVLV